MFEDAEGTQQGDYSGSCHWNLGVAMVLLTILSVGA
jgi:hypothetical protein